MDVFALVGAPTGSAARAVSQLASIASPPLPAAQAAPVGAPNDGAAPPGGALSAAQQIVDAPSAMPAVEQADLNNLPLAIKYAPSSPPSDALRAGNFDRLA